MNKKLKLFQSYFSNRSQLVLINETYSDFDLLEMGVSQESNFGQLLFIFFINHIINLNWFGEIQLFANDIVIKYINVDQLIFLLIQCSSLSSRTNKVKFLTI